MTDRIALAARNNALWCDAVARSLGVSCTTDDVAWTASTRTPPYYPDAVTLSPEALEYDVLARVDDSDGCSVKDSWARLDLGARASDDPASPVVAGAIVNVTGEVAGLGNLFSRDGDVERAWAAGAAAAREVAGGIPLVGWEAGASVDAAVAAGCERIGPLNVWLK